MQFLSGVCDESPRTRGITSPKTDYIGRSRVGNWIGLHMTPEGPGEIKSTATRVRIC